MPGISMSLQFDQLAPKWTTPLLANPHNLVTSPVHQHYNGHNYFLEQDNSER